MPDYQINPLILIHSKRDPRYRHLFSKRLPLSGASSVSSLRSEGMASFVKKNEKVLLKVNLLSAKEPGKAVTTHPELVRAVAHIRWQR